MKTDSPASSPTTLPPTRLGGNFVLPRYTRSVVGYHGTTAKIADAILKQGYFTASHYRHHWLGSGVYFFENAPYRAMTWARREAQKNGSAPGIVGVEIPLHDVLDLTDIHEWPYFVECYKDYVETVPKPKTQKPPNFETKPNDDLVFGMQEPSFAEKGAGNNQLDCEMIERVIDFTRAERRKTVTGVRAAFVEGAPIYLNSFLFSRAHVQLCIVDTSILIKPFLIEPATLENTMPYNYPDAAPSE